MRLKRLALALAAAILILACQIGPKPTPTTAPTPTQRAPDLQTPTVTATVAAQAAATATATRTPSPSPTEEPAVTVTRPPTSTPAPQQPAPSPTPRFPDAGPLPARWQEIDLSLPGGGVFYPGAATLEEDGEWAYVLGRCEPEPRYEGAPIPGCLATLDLASGVVLRTIELPIGYDARLTLAGGVAYLHPMWGGDLYALDAGALAAGTMPARQILSEVRAVAFDGQDTTYAVTRDELIRLSPDAASVPIDAKLDNYPIALAASPRHVFLLGYSALQVFTPELKPVGVFDLREENPRAMALDAEQDRAYIGAGSGLWAFDADTARLHRIDVQAQDGDPLRNVEWLIRDFSGERLLARVREPNDWYGGTAIVEITANGDVPSWPARTLFSTLEGQIGDAILDGERERLLLVSYVDHALIPLDLDSGRLAPRIPVGIEVQEVVVDPDAGRLIVSDSAGWVHILDHRTYDPIDHIYGGRAISLDNTHRRLYAGDPRLPVVTAFDADRFEPLWQAPLSGSPRAHPAADQVVVVSRRFDLLDGASGSPAGRWQPGVGQPTQECLGCYYTVATEAIVDSQRGLTMTTTYTPWPGKPGPSESIDYDPASGRAAYALLTGGYVHMSSLAIYADLGALQKREAPILSLEGLSGYIKLDPAARRMYVAREDALFVLDSDTLNRVGRVETDGWQPRVAAVDGGLGRLYTPRDGALVVWTRQGGAPPAPLPAEPAVLTRTVSAILPSPNYAADLTLLATVNGRLCRSTDGGVTWVRLQGGLPSFGKYYPLVAAAFSPDYANDRTLFAGLAFGDTHGEGVYCSPDGGDTWSACSAGLYDLRVRRVVPSPNYARDRTVLAYSRTQQGESLYRSTDAGQSWKLVQRQVSSGTPPLPVPEQVFPIADPLPQFRCDYRGDQGVTCARSADGGISWAPLSTAQFHIDSLVGTALSPDFETDGIAYWITQGAVYRYHDRSGTGEISTISPLYGVRDYTNGFTGIAVAAMAQGGQRLFLGTADGQFLSYPANALGWEKVWPLLDPIPAPTPTPCAVAVDGRFGVPAGTVLRLGCASIEASDLWVAAQSFERGRMLWLNLFLGEPSPRVVVLSDDGSWAAYSDTWSEGQQDRDPGLTPPQGLYQPIRGFGKVWREQLGGPEAGIGWAREVERGHAALVQQFTGGLLVRFEDGTIFALYDDGRAWQELP